MSSLLNSAAVGRQSGENAGEILSAYIATNPSMELNHTREAALETKPKGTAVGDQFEP